MKSQKAVFLDRDGVINEDNEYVGKVEDFIFVKGIFRALKKLQERGYKLFIITNQSGIGRGYYTEEDYKEITEYMLNEFEKNNITIEKVYFCKHTPEDNCNCRKPKPGMILQASKEFNIDLKNSWVIGDKLSDVEAGENVGCKTILINSGYVKDSTRKKFKDLYEAGEFILDNSR